MGNCNICGSNFKMLGGGTEPYTGCSFTVCNTCGELLKKINQAKKNRESQQCISLSVELLDRCKDPDTKSKVKQFTDKALEKSQEDLSQEGLVQLLRGIPVVAVPVEHQQLFRGRAVSNDIV